MAMMEITLKQKCQKYPKGEDKIGFGLMAIDSGRH